MLTPEELREVPDSVVKIYRDLEDEIIRDITRRLEKTGEITGTADWQIYMLQNMGKDLKDIKSKIKDTTELSKKEVDKIFNEAVQRSVEADNFLFTKAGKGILDLKDNPGILQFINANIKKTNNDLSNITKSLGFKDGNQFKPVARFYQDTLNYAHFQVSSGAFTPQQAINIAVKKIVDSGVRTIDYESGRSDRVDVAVRRAVLTSVNQTTSYVSLMQMKELGGEYVEVTAHMGARPDHQTWQGKVYKVSDGLLKKIGGSNVDNNTQKGYNGSDKKVAREEQLQNLVNRANNFDLSSSTPNDVIDLGREINEYFDISNHLGDKEKLKEIFSNFREMGGEFTDWAKGSSKLVKEQLNEAFSNYPKDWSKIPADNGKQILAKKVKRGYYVKKQQYFEIATEGTQKTTPYHEIGHMVECNNPELLRLSKEFIKQRTEGEDPTRLKDIFPMAGYSSHEDTLKDNFVDPYIGKIYPNATEVLSMGLQGVYVPDELFIKSYDRKTRKNERTSILDDEEFLNLIIGFIVKG